MTEDENNPDWRFREAGPEGYEEAGIAAFEVFRQQKGLPLVDVLVREAIQNSCDAQKDSEIVRVEIALRELSGEASAEFLEAMGYASLEPHLDGACKVGGTLAARIRDDGLEQIQGGKLRVLTIADSGTSGLWGEEREGKPPNSNFHPLVRKSMGTHEGGNAMQGGAFGLGKAVYWMTSGISTVLLHSIPAYEPNAETSRLIGRTWLPSHEADGKKWEHIGGWFGEVVDDGNEHEFAVSIWGENASERSKTLGAARPGAAPGTTIVIVAFDNPDAEEEPTVEETCEQISRAVREWYWPGLARKALSVTVTGEVDGSQIFDEDFENIPGGDPVIQMYLDAWMVARGQKDRDELGADAYESLVCEWPVPRRDADEKHEEVTASGLLAVRIADTTFEESDLANKVAVMRGATGMVVEYRAVPAPVSRKIQEGGRAFFGLLMAGTAFDQSEESKRMEQFLRASEPPAHDRWDKDQARVGSEYKTRGPVGTNVAAALRKIFQDCDDFLRKLVREEPPSGSRGPERLMKMLSFGKAGEPQNESRMIIRQGVAGPEKGGVWTFEGASYGLNSSQSWKTPSHKWSFTVSVAIDEDGRAGKTHLPISEITAAKDDGEVVNFTTGDTEAHIEATPGIDRVTFDLTVHLPSGMSSDKRTSRIAVVLEAKADKE